MPKKRDFNKYIEFIVFLLSKKHILIDYRNIHFIF